MMNYKCPSCHNKITMMILLSSYTRCTSCGKSVRAKCFFPAAITFAGGIFISAGIRTNNYPSVIVGCSFFIGGLLWLVCFPRLKSES